VIPIGLPSGFLPLKFFERATQLDSPTGQNLSPKVVIGIGSPIFRWNFKTNMEAVSNMVCGHF
jgi:hypothetical protein